MGLLKSRKGDIASLIYVIVVIFVLGLVLVLMNAMSDKLYSKLENNLNSSGAISPNSIAISKLQQIHQVDRVIWDYFFLAVFMVYIVSVGLSAYATRISPVFFWLYGILSLVGLLVGVISSNMYQAFITNNALSDVANRFPITNFVLGDYYPTIITLIICITLGLIFSKTPDRVEEFG